MRAGLFLPNFGVFADPRTLAALAAAAEEAGWDGLFLWDHVVRREGDLDVSDPWVLLSAASMVTSRILLGPMVTPLPRRRPWNVARAATTLDHLSGGRMVLGIGLGSPRGLEFSGFGEETDLVACGDLLDEGVAIIQAAWSGEPVRHDGPRLAVGGIRFLPRPVQRPGIPIWAATERRSGRAVRRAAGLDGIFPIGLQPADLAVLLTTVDAIRPAGSGSFDVVITDGGGPERWIDTGATWWLQPLAWDQPIEVARRVVDTGPPSLR